MTDLFQINAVSLLGVFVGLLLGLTAVAVISRFAYPALRHRHELAKVNGVRSAKPGTVLTLAKLAAFFLLPALGLVLANALNGNGSS